MAVGQLMSFRVTAIRVALRLGTVLLCLTAQPASAEKTTGAAGSRDGAFSLPQEPDAPANSNCDRFRALVRKAEELEQRGELEEAIQTARHVGFDSKCKGFFDQATTMRAKCLIFGLKRFEEGIQAADEGLKMSTRPGELWFTRGYALYHLDRNEEAIQSFRMSLVTSGS